MGSGRRDVHRLTARALRLNLSRDRSCSWMSSGIAGRVVKVLLLMLGSRWRGRDLLDGRLRSCVDPSLSWWVH